MTEVKVRVSPKILGTRIELITEMLTIDNGITRSVEELHRKVLNIEEKAVRECLINLGWTPPNEEQFHE